MAKRKLDPTKVTKNKAAEVLQISRSKINRWIREGLLEIKEDRVDLEKAKALLLAEKEEKEGKVQTEVDLTKRMKMAMAIYREEKAKIAMLERKQKEGSLVDVTTIAKLWQERALLIKNKILSLENSLPPLLERKGAKAIQEILRDKIREILDDLSNGAKGNNT